jgi:hypothetical protein
MIVSRRLLAALLATAVTSGAGVAATGASAATITATLPCVPNLGIGGAKTLPLAGTGFTPNATVAIRTATASDPAPRALTTLKADGAGNVRGLVDPPALHAPGTVDQSFTLAALDTVNAANTATTKFRAVRFGFDASPSTGRPTRRVTYTARGYRPGKPVYAHFRFGGKTRRNVRLGIATSPCGIVSKKLRLLPTKTRFGTWTIYMDQAPRYNKNTKNVSLQAKGTLVIRRTLGG